jgi:hypothetical protein
VVGVRVRRWLVAAGWRRRAILLVAVLLLVAVVGSVVAARRDGDQSAIDRLPSDVRISESWPGAVVSSRQEDPVHRLHEQQSIILNIRLVDNSNLTVTARDFGGPVRAWLVAKSYSPTWNGMYWNYPQRHSDGDVGSDALPHGGQLVGFECPDEGDQALECRRWVLWWKRGRGVWEAHWSAGKLTTSADAIAVLSPLWRGN